MRASGLRDRWQQGKAATMAWLSIGNSYVAEMAGCSGSDAVLVDLQHGMTDIGVMIGMLQAIATTPATPLVRVPSCDPPLLMKSLDAGAYGIVCPMIDSVAEAEAFVAATRYPPLGNRSFGPARGLLYGGADYFDNADRTIVRLAMIETVQGLAAVDDICTVDGLDGIFIGPNDLGLALGKAPDGDPTDSEVVSAIQHCLAAAHRHGRRAGIFCPSGKVAARRIAEGFDLVVPGSDANLLKAAITAEIKTAVAHT